MTDLSGLHIHITGVVQGVGFRPFVYGLAARLALTGWVRNTSAGVDIEVDGPPEALKNFIESLHRDAPPLARLDSLEVAARPANGFTSFEIQDSQPIAGAFQPISPDVSICPDCLRELFDPADRRYLYPFTNCTNCGPRFTIIQDLPYDRQKTTLAGFPLCPDCAAEYANPLDRRFHAQPVACPACGPEVWLEEVTRNEEFGITNSAKFLQPNSPGSQSVIQRAQKLLLDGKILAIKGLGGFHLACDATNPDAVAELRRRKLRVDKPFALMMPDLATVREHCWVSEAEEELLTSHERPVVILQRREGTSIALQVAPGQNTLGVMLPYTPLHYLLFADLKVKSGYSPAMPPLVMTSGNLSEEPIATDNDEARQGLEELADAFLMHNRPIHIRCDDAVMRVAPVGIGGAPTLLPLRRSRGYAPFPVHLAWEKPPILAVGAELKNTFCLTRSEYAFLSHHIGDLENYETLTSFEEGIAHFERLFRVQPQALAYDLHPNYLASRYALQRSEKENLPAFGIQHHHAHIAAGMAEHGLTDDRPVIGVAFDGTGYGDDGAIWGGEFLITQYTAFQRAAHLKYYPLPGGDAAIRKPARIALAYLWQAGLEWEPELACVGNLCAEERTALQAMLTHQLNISQTSSFGRLFDAAAALAGVRQQVNYEAQAAIELEAMSDPDENGSYSFGIEPPSAGEPAATHWVIDPAPVLAAMLTDTLNRVPVGTISARFHTAAALMVVEVCQRLRRATGLEEVLLSGGVWQNLTLLKATAERLRRAGFTLYFHQLVPPNDGGLALGQAAVAAHRL